jgi:hypothetical protein
MFQLGFFYFNYIFFAGSVLVMSVHILSAAGVCWDTDVDVQKWRETKIPKDLISLDLSQNSLPRAIYPSLLKIITICDSNF